MKELELKYGCNPNQKPSRIFMEEGELPIKVLNGKPGYINFLDAFNGWQLVKELKKATGLPAATSFKHVSPALSDVCDVSTAALIKREFSDGIIAPGYEPEALELLKGKKRGAYAIIEIDPDYVPNPIERKQVFGITFEQGRNELNIDDDFFSNVVTENKDIPESAKIDMAISMITLKYTQSNSVCFVKNGQAIGVGAGQQSRIHCVRLAGQKADNWLLRQCPKVLNLPFKEDMKRADRDNAIDLYIGDEYMDILADGEWQRVFTEKPEVFTKEEKQEWLSQAEGITLGSDAFFPFSDNIERAAKSGVKYVAQPGGSIRDQDVIDACNKHGMAMAFTGIRLFHH